MTLVGKEFNMLCGTRSLVFGLSLHLCRYFTGSSSVGS